MNKTYSSLNQQKRATRHGKRHTNEWHIWAQMKGRCLNPNNKGYKNYGERGIKVCDKWMSFEGFYEDMGDQPYKRASIERINVNGNYELSNCKWIPSADQSKNRRNLIKVNDTFGAEFARRHKIAKATLYRKIKAGWIPEDIVRVYGKNV